MDQQVHQVWTCCNFFFYPTGGEDFNFCAKNLFLFSWFTIFFSIQSHACFLIKSRQNPIPFFIFHSFIVYKVLYWVDISRKCAGTILVPGVDKYHTWQQIGLYSVIPLDHQNGNRVRQMYVQLLQKKNGGRGKEFFQLNFFIVPLSAFNELSGFINLQRAKTVATIYIWQSHYNAMI